MLGSRHGYQVAFWAGCSAIAAGLLLALIGTWVAAIPALVAGLALLVAIGAWHLPYTGSGYAAGVARAFEDWEHLANYYAERRATEDYRAESIRLIARVEKLRPPAALRDHQGRLIEALDRHVDTLDAYSAARARDERGAAAAAAESAYMAARDELLAVANELDPDGGD